MKKKLITLWALCAAAVVTALVLTSASFAWFTANREVGTDRVSARTGSNMLELEIGRMEGKNFRPGKNNVVALKQQNTPLMPVSTADLKTFVYNPGTVDGFAEEFLPTQDESLYYHDTICMRVKGDGMPEGTKVSLYLDNTDTPIAESLDGELLTAARLGMVFGDSKPVILRLSDVDEGAGNTRPGGVAIGNGQVLSYSGGAVTAVKDPSVLLTQVQMSKDGIPGKRPIATLELNKLYTVDIYFYLEGCDPDCVSDKVALDTAALGLAFYGLIAG